MRKGTVTRVWKRVDLILGMEEYKNYEVSNLGEIRSLYYEGFIGSKILKGKNNSRGYLFVSLHINGKRKNFYIHRLVALAFIPNDNSINKTEVNHINEIKTDNRAENLEWCDRVYNNNYGNRNKKISESNKGKTKKRIKTKSRSGKKIKCIELDMIFDSILEASIFLGKGENGRVNIGACLRKVNNQQTAFGYHWEYVD